MGYDMTIAVLKKKSLNKVQEELNKTDMRYLYSNFLFIRLYPEEYEIEEDECGRCIAWSNKNIFKNFFETPIENEEVVVINKETYEKLISWLEEKLKNLTLLDIAINEDYNEFNFDEMIKVYRQLKKESIDFETEFIIFEHNW